jgi:putative NADPH-quinone reductase
MHRRDFLKTSQLIAGGVFGTAGIGAATSLFYENNRQMKIIAINGSPRKNRNTATMCKHFLEGAVSAGKNVQTSLINLYDYSFKGCVSCFACKRKNSITYGKCTYKDGISELLDEVSSADGVVFGTPIYFGYFSSVMHSFLERLLFPYATYEKDYRTIAPKRFPTAMIYTMNIPEEKFKTSGHVNLTEHMENCIGQVFSPPKLLYAYNTYQFNDYSSFEAERFNEQEKAIHKKNQFPIDCKNAFDAGKTMIESKTK